MRIGVALIVAAGVVLAACTSTPHDTAPPLADGAGGAAGGAAEAGGSGGSTSVAGSTAGTGMLAAAGSAGSAFAGTGGASGAAGAAIAGTTGEGGTGGQAAGGTGGADDPPATASGEDDGTDCALGALPDAGSLPTIARLPDPFEKLDGTRMSTAAEWRCRRAEIKRMAETYAFGTKPPPPESVSGTVSNDRITVDVMDGGNDTSFSVTVELPAGGDAPYPFIVVYGGGGFGAPLESSVIDGEGIALVTYDPFDVGREGTPRSAKQGAFYDLYGSDSSTGLLVAWGWGVSRIIDVVERSDGSILAADAAGVTGCSRFGKGAFLAGVFDQRIALTMPIESGTAGVPIWRGIPGEGAQSLQSGYGEQPWFGDAFGAFTDDPTRAPIDTHELVAMVAPRGLFIMDNPHIANLGPRSAHVAALAGAEVYAALGAQDAISYVSDVASGSHCSVRPEWTAPLRSSVQKHLRKTGGAAGVIRASSRATGDLSEWRDWATPTLQ